MRYIVSAFIFLLPLHALMVTFFSCGVGVNEKIINIIRFWKEIVIIVLLFYSVYHLFKKNKFSIKRVYKNNTLLGITTAFVICSFVFLWFPFFYTETIHITENFEIPGFPLDFRLLGFKYDVFFLFALIIGLYIPRKKEDFNFYLKSALISVSIILIIFLPWYLSGNIGLMSTILGYSDKVSTYTAGSCISFAQNVSGHHRFQATFGGPIRFSVFLTMFYILSIGFILNIIKNKKGIKRFLFKKEEIFSGENKKEIIAIIVLSIFCILSIFLSYSKTSVLGLLFGIVLFVYLVRKIIYKKSFNRMFLYYSGAILSIPVLLILIFKRDLFLHIGSTLNRLDNLKISVEKFFYNPIGGGLGVAGPASWVGTTMESAGPWELADATVNRTYKFLPENWYVQILLEQGIVGFALFASLLIVIGLMLYKKVLAKKDYFSIAMFTAFITLCFMGNLTHVFEESATSYILFFLIGMYLSTKSD